MSNLSYPYYNITILSPYVFFSCQKREFSFINEKSAESAKLKIFVNQPCKQTTAREFPHLSRLAYYSAVMLLQKSNGSWEIYNMSMDVSILVLAHKHAQTFKLDVRQWCEILTHLSLSLFIWFGHATLMLHEAIHWCGQNLLFCERVLAKLVSPLSF